MIVVLPKRMLEMLGVRIVAGFKEGGGRFFKVARGGKVYTEITEGVAMQSKFVVRNAAIIGLTLLLLILMIFIFLIDSF